MADSRRTLEYGGDSTPAAMLRVNAAAVFDSVGYPARPVLPRRGNGAARDVVVPAEQARRHEELEQNGDKSRHQRFGRIGRRVFQALRDQGLLGNAIIVTSRGVAARMQTEEASTERLTWAAAVDTPGR